MATCSWVSGFLVSVTVSGLGYTDVQVQSFGTPRDVLIRLPVQKGVTSAQQSEQVLQALKAGDANVVLRRTEFVGPQVGDELVHGGLMALGMVVSVEALLQRVHPDDSALLRRVLEQAARGERYEVEYRVELPQGGLRWVASRGSCEMGSDGMPQLVRGWRSPLLARGPTDPHIPRAVAGTCRSKKDPVGWAGRVSKV
eukprot:gene45344-56478_t